MVIVYNFKQDFPMYFKQLLKTITIEALQWLRLTYFHSRCTIFSLIHEYRLYFCKMSQYFFLETLKIITNI